MKHLKAKRFVFWPWPKAAAVLQQSQCGKAQITHGTVTQVHSVKTQFATVAATATNALHCNCLPQATGRCHCLTRRLKPKPSSSPTKVPASSPAVSRVSSRRLLHTKPAIKLSQSDSNASHCRFVCEAHGPVEFQPAAPGKDNGGQPRLDER